MKLIVGLGNPGIFYAYNRHNIGFMCVRHLGNTYRIKLNKKQGPARTGEGEIEGQRVMLARPQTYMNESGEPISRLINQLNITPGDLIVIHDDLDLPVGKLRLRFGGSSGGHKGITSIIECIGSGDFYRIRVGIGRPDEGTQTDKESAVIDHVLSNFSRDEKKIIKRIVPEVDKAIACLITEGLEVAMNKYN